MGAEDNLHKVETGFAAVNARDIDTFIALLDPEFQLRLVLKPQMIQQQSSLDGPAELRHYLGLLYSTFPDYHMDQVTLRASGNMVYHEVMVRGTHQESFTLPNGITVPATGRQVEIPVEVYHTFDTAGRYMSSTINVNLLDVMKQFGNK